MSKSVKLVISKMSKTLKITLWSLLIVLLVGGTGYLVGRGSGGGGNIERIVPFSITVNPSGSYEIAITPVDAVVTKGDPLVFSITATMTGGFDASIGLTVGGLPAGSYTFGTTTLTPAQRTTTLTVNTTLLTSNSVYSCNLSAVDK
jgi:hypothetical protein